MKKLKLILFLSQISFFLNAKVYEELRTREKMLVDSLASSGLEPRMQEPSKSSLTLSSSTDTNSVRIPSATPIPDANSGYTVSSLTSPSSTRTRSSRRSSSNLGLENLFKETSNTPASKPQSPTLNPSPNSSTPPATKPSALTKAKATLKPQQIAAASANIKDINYFEPIDNDFILGMNIGNHINNLIQKKNENIASWQGTWKGWRHSTSGLKISFERYLYSDKEDKDFRGNLGSSHDDYSTEGNNKKKEYRLHLWYFPITNSYEINYERLSSLDDNYVDFGPPISFKDITTIGNERTNNATNFLNEKKQNFKFYHCPLYYALKNLDEEGRKAKIKKIFHLPDHVDLKNIG